MNSYAAAIRPADFIPPITLTRAESQEMGVTLPAAPPPPGVSTVLVAVCAFGALLTVLLFVRGEQVLAPLLR